MKKPGLIIGIDGGATKTAVLLSDPRGQKLAEETGGPTNFQVIGTEQAAKILLSLITQCCSKAGRTPSEVSSVVLGLTGAGRESDKARMRDAFVDHARSTKISFPNLVVESDARIALEGAFKGDAGIILVSGTGSIAFGKAYNGSLHRVGGWGRTFGDEGSGFSIGCEGLNAVSRHLDGRIRGTLLTKLVAERFGLSDQERIITAVYREHFDLATIAPLVLEAAAKGDLECGRIVNRAAFELTELARALTMKIEGADRARARQKLPLAFLGGILTSDNVLTKILHHKITFSLPQIKIVEPAAPPEYGAVLLAIKAATSSS